MPRSSLAVTWSVWRALFLREALYRLFHRRAAWVWLLLEPIGMIAFLVAVYEVLRVRVVGGIGAGLWIMVGLLGFFLFRRTMTLTMAAVSMAKPLFAYRQVRAVDAVLVRGATEGMLMSVIALLLLFAAGFVGLEVMPDNLLVVLANALGLWLLGLGLGLILSVPRELVPEVGEIVNLVMTPLYFLSGAIFPLATIPSPYLDWLLLNPVAHGLEGMRLGFADHYAPVEGLAQAYPFAFGLVCLLIGLVLHRIYRKRLIQQ